MRPRPDLAGEMRPRPDLAGEAIADDAGEREERTHHGQPPARLLGCGHAEYGQLGLTGGGASGDAASGDAVRDYPLPRWIHLDETCGEPVAVSCGALHTAVLTATGGCLTFGWGSTGALGHGSCGYELEARPVELLRRRRLVGVAAGARHTVVLEEREESSASLSRDLGALLSARTDADCAVVAGRGAGSRWYPAHRSVLCARCPRLLAMLAFSARYCRAPLPAAVGAGAPQPPLPTLWLPTVRAPIMGLLLSYVYTGQFRCTERLFLEQLRKAADMLRLPRLAAECVELGDGEAGRVVGDTKRVDAPLAVRRTVAPPIGMPDAVGCEARCRERLPEAFGWLLDDRSFTDLHLVATDGGVDVSRALLCARSPDFFRTMLHGRFRESRLASAEVAISVDLRPYGICERVLRLLVRFIYTGRVTRLSMRQDKLVGSSGARSDLEWMEASDALHLMPHACAFLMDDLKRLCEAVLVAVVDADNAAQLLQVADECFAERLKVACTDVLRSSGHPSALDIIISTRPTETRDATT